MAISTRELNDLTEKAFAALTIDPKEDQSSNQDSSFELVPRPEELQKENNSTLLFGADSKQEASQPGLFSFTTKPSQTGLFSFNTSKPTPSLFGSSQGNSNQKSSQKGLFSGVFGGKSSSLPFGSLFGKSEKTESKPTGVAKDEPEAETQLASADIEAEPTNITFKPIVKLEEVKNHDNGQANDEILFEEISKIYRFELERNEWIDYGKVKLQVSVDKTNQYSVVGKIVARDTVTQKLRLCGSISRNGNLEVKKERACSWGMKDWTKEGGEEVLISAKFAAKEIRDRFMQQYNTVLAMQGK